MFKNTQTLNWWTDWIGWMDLSQNITPPRAPCGANKVFSLVLFDCKIFALSFSFVSRPKKVMGHVSLANANTWKPEEKSCWVLPCLQVQSFGAVSEFSKSAKSPPPRVSCPALLYCESFVIIICGIRNITSLITSEESRKAGFRPLNQRLTVTIIQKTAQLLAASPFTAEQCHIRWCCL